MTAAHGPRFAARRGAAGLAAVAAVLAGSAPRVAAQDDGLDRACRSFASADAVSECRLSAGAARVIQPRLGAALFGGNEVPGTGSTLGMKLGSLPRISVDGRVVVAPVELPPIRDRTRNAGERAWLTGLGLDASVGLLSGFSPVPTVGGVLSVDAIARGAWVPLPRGRGFRDGGAWGWALGARLGLLRESFTLPGVSATATYGRISDVTFGDPAGGTDGFFEGPVSDLRLALAASRRVALIGITAGATWDRYASDVRAGFTESPGGARIEAAGQAVHERWMAYVNLSWTLLIFHVSGELGWQQAPVPDGLPFGVEVDPAGWFAGIAFRASI